MSRKKIAAQRKAAAGRSNERYQRAAYVVAPTALDEATARAREAIIAQTGERTTDLVRRLLRDEACRMAAGESSACPQSPQEQLHDACVKFLGHVSSFHGRTSSLYSAAAECVRKVLAGVL